MAWITKIRTVECPRCRARRRVTNDRCSCGADCSAARTAAGTKVRYKVAERDATGRVRYRSFERAAAAGAEKARLDHQRASGLDADLAAGRTTLGELWDWYARHRPPRELSTLVSYEGHYDRRIAPKLGHMPLRAITPRVVTEFFGGLSEDVLCRDPETGEPTRSGTETLLNVRKVLHRLFVVAAEEGFVARATPNPVIWRPARPAPALEDDEDGALDEVQPWEVEEVERVRAELPARDRALMLVFAYGGLRGGEAMFLRMRDLDEPGGRLRVRGAFKVGRAGKLYPGPPKSGDRRDVPVPSFVMRELLEHVREHRRGAGPDDRVFASPSGKVLRIGNWRRRAFNDACEAGGIPPERRKPHHLRHTAASLMAAAGWPEVAIRRALGHGSASMARHYVHRYGRDDRALTARLERYVSRSRGEAKVVALRPARER